MTKANTGCDPCKNEPRDESETPELVARREREASANSVRAHYETAASVTHLRNYWQSGKEEAGRRDIDVRLGSCS
jgi:hypothetical protein